MAVIISKTGQILKGRTEYQKTHNPTKRRENLCQGKAGKNGVCPDCGRYLLRISRAGHLPGNTGCMGWTEDFADGSRVITDGQG